MPPTLYITDITNNPHSASGDWQFGGTPILPNAVFGTWKSFSEIIDQTTSPATVTVTAGLDPVKNNWNLGPGSDAPPAGTANDGYGTEVRWNLAPLQQAGILVPGHIYRFYVMVHDGDQNKVGGDAGQAVFTYTYPGTVTNNPPASVSGFVTNGTQGGPIQGVTLTLSQLINGSWVVITTTTTAADGSYSFNNLQPGTYSVTQTPPPPPTGYVTETTTSQVGTVNGATDGSVGATSDVLTGINLGFSDNGLQYDFIDYFANPVG
jgi:hypothetical protein